MFCNLKKLLCLALGVSVISMTRPETCMRKT